MTAARPRHRVPTGSLALLAVLLACGAAGSDGPKPADLDDLALIPADARGFLSVRVADLWQTPAVRKGVANAKKRDPKLEDPAERMGEGVRPEAGPRWKA